MSEPRRKPSKKLTKAEIRAEHRRLFVAASAVGAALFVLTRRVLPVAPFDDLDGTWSEGGFSVSFYTYVPSKYVYLEATPLRGGNRGYQIEFQTRTTPRGLERLEQRVRQDYNAAFNRLRAFCKKHGLEATL